MITWRSLLGTTVVCHGGAFSIKRRTNSTVAVGTGSAVVVSERTSADAAASNAAAAKLNLSLRLGEMDIGAMVKATKAAVAKERLWRDAVVGGEVDVPKETELIAAIIPKKEDQLLSNSGVGSSGTTTVSDARNTRLGLSGAVAVGGVGNDLSWDRIAPEKFQGRSSGPHVRYGLTDMLRDCLISGDWTRAMRLFQSAIETACSSVEGSTPTLAPASDGHVAVSDEMLDILRRFNATLPSDTFQINVERHRGILRWSGGHYYLLMKLLLTRHRVVEAEKLWDVMKRIGYVDFRMNGQTCNQLMTLCRTDAAKDIVSPLLRPKGETQSHEGAFRCRLVTELEDWAEKRHATLSGRNRNTARVAQATSIVKSGEPSGKMDGVGGLNGIGLKLGDFVGLLRRCNSEESTMRVLQMMEKLSVVRDTEIYCALIAALRQPHYHVGDGRASESQSAETKEAYDAHRRKRLERARQWYNECPEEARTIDVCNEMLLITRGGGTEVEDYANLLTDIRGAPLAILGPSAADADSGENERQQKPRLAPAKWKVHPNGRTYEVMVSHCRYREEWAIVWALYDEMMERNVKGTPRLYRMLMEIVQRHPPCGRDKNTVVLELYEDMKRFGLDVTDIKSTANIVNSWCATRRKRRW